MSKICLKKKVHWAKTVSMHDKVLLYGCPFLVMHKERLQMNKNLTSSMDSRVLKLNRPICASSSSLMARDCCRGTLILGRGKNRNNYRGILILREGYKKLGQLLIKIWPKPLYNRNVIKTNIGIMPKYNLTHV